MAVEVPFSPGAAVVPPKSPLFTLGVATKKGFKILDSRGLSARAIPVVPVPFVSAGFGGKPKKLLGVLDVPVID